MNAIPMTYLSPKTAVRQSQIQGKGLFAKVPITSGEIVAIKGGYILSQAQRLFVSRHLNYNLLRQDSWMRFRPGLFNHHRVGVSDIAFKFSQ